MKDIYEALNNIDITEDDFCEVEVNEFEEQRIIKNLKETINKENLNKPKKRRHVAAIASVVVSASLVMMLPTYAKDIPIISDIFKVLGNPIYQNYKENANEINITKESKDIKITVNDAIFDGTNLSITYTVESEKNLGEDITAASNIHIKGNRNNDIAGTSSFTKINDNTYVGKESFTIYDYVGNYTESLNFTLNINRILMLDKNDEINGKWNFNISINATEGEVKELNISKEGSGITVNLDKLIINPMSEVINYSQYVSDEVKNKYDSVTVSLEVRDDLGNKYSVEEKYSTGNSDLYLESSVVLEKVDSKASKLIITPKAITKVYGDVKYVDQNVKDNKTGEESTGLAENYECVEYNEIYLDDIVIEIN